MLLTRKTREVAAPRSRLTRSVSGVVGQTIDRRAFLKRSGLAVGAGAAVAQLPFSIVDQAAAQADGASKTEVKRTICTHCSVGCAVDATVQNGVWVRQEPVFDSPINLGAHCAKGASIREHGMSHDSHRLKSPMKLVGGKWQKVTWDQALEEVSQKLLQIRKESGPDATFWIGSSKHNNEQAMLLRKFVSYFGTNNCDHQARICHSTTVAGVANTWGYGAMTNSYNDEQNSKCILFFGSNAAEAHPVSMLHTLHAKENGAKVIVVDPRFTRTAAKADKYYRIRSGSDVAFLMGMLYHIFQNGWEDKDYIRTRVYGMDKVREEAKKWTPAEVERVTGMKEQEVRDVAETMAKNRPSTIVWAMGQTQHTNGNAIVRASCILQLALGNIGVSGGGANIYRGHDNVQGATDVGPNPDSLPGYYGIATGSWKHWAAVWGVDYEWIKKQFVSQAMMEKPGITVSRWIDAVLEKKREHRSGSESACGDLLGPCAQQPEPRQGNARGDEEAGSARRRRSLSVGDGGDGGDVAQGRRVFAAGCHPARMRGIGDRVQPLDPMARKSHRPDVRLAHRSHDHVPARAEARLRQGVRRPHQARQGQGRHGRAGHGGYAQGNQPRHLDDRLHGPVAGAVAGAHA